MNKIIIHVLLATLYMNTCTAAASSSSESSSAAQQNTYKERPLAIIDRSSGLEGYSVRHQEFVRACSLLNTRDDILQAWWLVGRHGHDAKEQEIWKQHAHKLPSDDQKFLLFSSQSFAALFTNRQNNLNGQPTDTLEWLAEHGNQSQVMNYTDRLLRRGANLFHPSTEGKKSACLILFENDKMEGLLRDRHLLPPKDNITLAICRTLLNEYTSEQLMTQNPDDLLGRFETVIYYGLYTPLAIPIEANMYDNDKDTLISLYFLVKECKHKKLPVIQNLLKGIQRQLSYFVSVDQTLSDDDYSDRNNTDDARQVYSEGDCDSDVEVKFDTSDSDNDSRDSFSSDSEEDTHFGYRFE